MTVENSNREISYTGNDSVTVFAYNFLVYSDDHIFIYLDDVEQTVGFTINGVGDDSGGDITFTIAPENNVIVKIERIVPISQLIEYQQYGPFDAKSNERGLDLGAMVDSQLADLIAANSEKVAKAIRVALTDPTPEVDLTLPSAAERANKFMGFDANGKAVVTDLPTSLDPTTPFVRKDLIQAETGVTTYTLMNEAGSSHALFWDGREQQPAAYDIVGDQLTVNFEVEDGQTLSVWYEINGLPINTGDRLGSIGNPIIFLTTAAALNASGTLLTGDWFTTLGDGVPYDGRNANYQVVGDENAGDSDGYEVLDLDGKKGRLMFRAPFSSDTPIIPEIIVDNKPYDFSFPANDLERQEMLLNVAGGSIGPGGSTWWTRPVAVGRKEDGKDVIYRGDTYGSPENRDLEQGLTDLTLWTNKRLGEAIIKTTRLVFDGSDYEYSFTALNDQLVSYREDEHHQPSVLFSNINGKLITAWGSRNSARDQDGADVSNINYQRYGQDSETLSASEKIEYTVTADYASLFWVGRTLFNFSRVNVGDWHFARGSGENMSAPLHFFDAQGTDIEQQFYFGISGVDKSQVLANPQSSTDRNLVHFFGSPHPTANPDNSLYYCKGTFVLAGQEAVPFDEGGLFITKKDGLTPVSGSDGKLDGTFAAFQKTAMDVAYNPGVGKSYRLLDVYYGDDSIALLAVFNYTWTHGDQVPYGTTYDLVTVRSTAGGAFVASTIKVGLRGMLGYDPTQNNSGNGNVGVEGYTSMYALGASFWRGKDYTDTQPIIYYCDRDGDRRDGYRLSRINCTDLSFATVSTTDVLIENSSKILYRPEMTLYGDKRILWFNSANGWSGFNSFVTDTKFIDETI